MNGIESDPTAVSEDDPQVSAPPHSKFVVANFPDKTKAEQAIRAIRMLAGRAGIRIYAGALAARGSDGRLAISEIAREGHGIAGAAALIGAVAGLPMGPAAATMGAAAGATIGQVGDRRKRGSLHRVSWQAREQTGS
jgi:uncharacterized membrane protein